MEEPLSDALDAVRAFVVGREPLGDSLRAISQHAVDALRADMAGLTLLYPDGAARTAVATAPTASQVDGAQYASDRGPCLEAFRTRAIVRMDDIAADGRWPEFAAAAVEHGIASSLSLPLVEGGRGIGALNLYSTHAAHFCDEDESDGMTFARQATIALANAEAYWEQATLVENLRSAMDSRAVIEQAKGILIATTGCTVEEAFDLLRAQSQAENRKLREVASDLVLLQRRRPSDEER